MQAIRQVTRQATLVMVLATVLLVGMGREARTQASMSSGWWTSAPVAVAPDAPADGLVVQGGSDINSPTAFAAVSYALDEGSAPTALKLTVHSGSATTPAAELALCPLTVANFTPAQGGTSDAPKYDCGSKVTASPDADGTTYSFQVAGLVQSGGLAVAIVPTASTSRVVFDKPTESSLEGAASTTSSSSSSDFSSDSSTSDFATSPDTGTSTGETPLGLPGASADFSAPSDAGTATQQAAPAAPAQTDNAPAAAPATQPAAASGDKGTSIRGPLFVLLLLAAAGLWFVAGSGGFAGAEEAATPAAGQ